MKVKRRRKAERIKPADFGLEELSKINKDDVVRVMDRSRERTGEKLSDESGLYVPKRDPYYYDIEKFSPESSYGSKISRKNNLSDSKREDYSYGKIFAVGEQYLERESYSQKDYNDDYLYDEYDSDRDFSVESVFNDSRIQQLENTGDQADALRERARTYRADAMEEVSYENSQFDLYNISYVDDDLQNTESEAVASVLYEAARRAQEEEIQAQSESEFAEDIRAQSQSKFAEEIQVQSESEFAEEINSLRNGNYSEEYSADKSVERELDSEEENEQLDPEKEKLLNEVLDKINGNASPKEKLIAQREAIRLGMVDALVESDHSEMVRPELLEEIGFTPGGSAEPEIVKNKRFKFGRKKKEISKDELKKLSDNGKITDNLNDASDLKNKETSGLENKEADVSDREHSVVRSSIAQKQIKDMDASKINRKKASRPQEAKERRSEVMKDPVKRVEYIRKNKERLDKAGNDLIKMQDNYDALTQCLNDMVLLEELPEDVSKNIKHTASMVVKYKNESSKMKNVCQMDDAVFYCMNRDKDKIPDTIRRLTENEKYVDKMKADIDRLEKEKESCQDEREETEDKRRRTKNISIAVMILTVITMSILIVLQLVMEIDMQIPILLFGVCAILETLGIFVQHFKSETNETTNHYKLNKLIKKQNSQKVKYVNTLNAVEFIYKKYNINSSSELLFQWEQYQRTVQAREDYRIAGKEVLYYEQRLEEILKEYGFSNVEQWVSQAEFFVEGNEMQQMKEKMTRKRSKLMERMEKCKKLMGKIDSELSVLVIKFPQYADEIKSIINEL